MKDIVMLLMQVYIVQLHRTVRYIMMVYMKDVVDVRSDSGS